MSQDTPRRYWKKRRPEVIGVGEASCQYRIPGDPRVRELMIYLRRDREFAVIELDGTKHEVPFEVVRILQGFDIDGI